jgi:hypothetical protein
MGSANHHSQSAVGPNITFLREDYLQTIDPANRPFMAVFVGTQMFAEYVQRQMGN